MDFSIRRKRRIDRPETNPMRVALHSGDVLSYSAGSTQTGPLGFRKVNGRGNLMASAAKRWPELVATVVERPLLFINSYPATIGTLATGVTVDTYLSARVLSRALQLAERTEHSALVAGQPLFVADALLRHIASDRPLPETVMLWLGGYALPQSLERTLRSLLASRVRHFSVIQWFGAAEVDAGCLMACERDSEGEPIYYPRDDVTLRLDGDELLLTLLAPNGRPVVERFRTGDRARAAGEGWRVWNHKRVHPEVRRGLESWSDADWRRRTGYMGYDEGKSWIQLREGELPKEPTEIEHYEFARRFGFSWLDKPDWRGEA